MRPRIEPSNDLALSSPFRSWLDCITNTSGYDFRKGHGLPAGAVASPVTFTNIEKTSTVPARVGVEFGLEYKIVGEPSGAEVTLEFVNTYPGAGLADPNSPEPLRESRFKKMKPIGKVLYFGYGFENDWELVPGTWTFEIWSDGRKLAEEKFTVIK
jgi:hypothetical protein